MALTDNPIPARPRDFSPHGAPPGITADFSLYHNGNGGLWWPTRPVIKPKVIVVHTNAASREGNSQSQVNWGNMGVYSKTHPHYAINQPTPRKLVPSDRRGIGNSSPSWFETQTGIKDPSFWSLVIETADEGWKRSAELNRPSEDIGPFLYHHAELVARIYAYESIVWNIPLRVNDPWHAAGCCTHTDPYPYPHFTSYEGKWCPGKTKESQFWNIILPRASQIRASWVGDPEPIPENPYGLYPFNNPVQNPKGRPWKAVLEVGATDATSGGAVSYFQRVAKKAGVYSYAIDGDYGQKSREAAITLQSRLRFPERGMVGWGWPHWENKDGNTVGYGPNALWREIDLLAGNKYELAKPVVDPPPPPPPPPDKYDPPKTWGGYPYNKSKSTLKRGSSGPQVKYLQDVIKRWSNHTIVVDGSFGPSTETDVKNLQKVLGITSDGIVGWDGSSSSPGPNATWPKLDAHAISITPDPEPPPPPPPPPPPENEVVAVGNCYYRLPNPIKWAWSVSEDIYGTGTKHELITDDDFTEKNVARHGWNPGTMVRGPGVTGWRTKLKSGEGAAAVSRRVYKKPQSYWPAEEIKDFYTYNGGKKVAESLPEGAWVWFPR